MFWVFGLPKNREPVSPDPQLVAEVAIRVRVNRNNVVLIAVFIVGCNGFFTRSFGIRMPKDISTIRLILVFSSNFCEYLSEIDPRLE